MKLHHCASIVFVVAAFSLIRCGSAQFKQNPSNNGFTKPPMVFHNWPPKHLAQPQQQLPQQSMLQPQISQKSYPQYQPLDQKQQQQQQQTQPKVILKPAPLRTIMLQIRSSSNPQSQIIQPTRLLMNRPIKASLPPRIVLKAAPIIHKRPLLHQLKKPGFPVLQSQPYKFESPSGPIKSNDYVFENIKKPIRFQSSVRLQPESPIHTIPAPNLSPHNDKLQTPSEIVKPIDNHLDFGGFKSNSPAPSTMVGATASQRPSHVHQYQVTEQTNDLTIKNQVSGQKTYFAPDPDPGLPSHRVQPSSDPLSTPTNNKNVLPPDVYSKLVQSHPQFQDAANAAALVQRPYDLDSVPQYTVTDTYGIPLGTKPQLQQHILQQTSMLQGMPSSAYNPTYLVTQSNNLFNQHQQQLFKPVDSNYIGTVTPGHVVFGSYTFNNNNNQNQESVASPGQIYAAAQNQLSELQSAITQPHHDHSYSSNSNNYQQSESQDLPQYASLVDNNNLNNNNIYNNYNNHQQDSLSEQEISNLLNYGSLNLQGQFIPSGEHQQSNEAYDELFQRQQENERILQQANRDLYNKQMNEEMNAHEMHRLAVEQQLKGGSNSNGLRIFVPDSEENNYAQNRSDNLYVDEEYYDNNEEPQSDDNGSSASETTADAAAYDDADEQQN